jgi:murein DD-endopeptidase MepM/ murein hydrolase activator NlpD
MGDKVIRVDDLISWLNENAFECDEQQPPLPPTEPFRLIWPVPDPKVVTQWYGVNPQFYPGQAGHEGLDMRALNGTPVYAMASGEVYRVEPADVGAYGKQVRIKHEHDGEVYKTIYAHFAEPKVVVGQKVNSGELIGLADNTGNSTGPHLHITLKWVGNGSNWMNLNDIVNPVPYMPDLFPGNGWRVDVGGNFRTSPALGNNLIRYIPPNNAVAATGEFEHDWWEIIFAGVKGWFWNPGYKLFPV